MRWAVGLWLRWWSLLRKRQLNHEIIPIPTETTATGDRLGEKWGPPRSGPLPVQTRCTPGANPLATGGAPGVERVCTGSAWEDVRIHLSRFGAPAVPLSATGHRAVWSR